MTVHLRFFLIALTVQAIPLASFAADARGWVEEDCIGSIFHLAKIDGIPITQEIILRLNNCGSGIPLALCMTEANPYEVQGKRCSGAGKCEEATQAKVWLNKGNGRIRRISGRYTVDFSGQHLEGQFMVNYRKHKKPFICE
jgi:hypothetical protein